MRNHVIKFKLDSMLCHRCLSNIVKTVSSINGIEKLDISLETKKIKVAYNNSTIKKEKLQEIVNKTIISGKAQMLS